MRFLNWLMALVCVMALAACGGGGGDAGTNPFPPGGGTDGGATALPTITMSLEDSAGTVLPSQAISGTQSATAVAVVLDSTGKPVPNLLVAFTGSSLVLTPATGQTITDSQGRASVSIASLDPFSSGATSITASSSVAGTAITASLDIGLGAATTSLSAMTTSADTVPAYQTITVSVPATVDGSNPAVQYEVAFAATCGTFDPPTASTDSSGIARSAYRNQVGTSACSGTQTLTATAGTSVATKDVTAQAPVAANIIFVSSAPARIYLSGSPGVSQSILQFKLVDSNGNPVQGRNVKLDMTLKPPGAYLGSNPGTSTLTQPTNADGTVDVAVNAGAEPGPVQVKATLLDVAGNGTAISNVSNSLSVASGLPVQRAFSLSVSTFNIEALNEDGVTTTITLRIADRLGNPVPDGTTVNFVTEGGQVVASCSTTGASANNTSGCSVVLSSQAPRPSNGRLTVLAWAQGEENYTELSTPTNNTYDVGEPFEDLGQPFLDKNENGQYDEGVDITVGTSSGTSACPATSYLSVPKTCSGAWGPALVRQQAVIVFSGSDPFLTSSGLVSTGSNRCSLAFNLSDVNGNPMPAGTTLAVSSVTGGGVTGSTTPLAVFEGFGGDGDKVPNTAAAGGTNHSAIFSSCSDPASLQFKLVVTTPKKTTTFLLP